MAKVVVIEDETILRELIRDELEKQDFLVFTASDGVKGWELIQKEIPDIVLLDLLMPNMNGYEVLTHLRSQGPLSTIPCIVISNSGQTADLNRAFSLGANDVLIKAEFNPDQVVKKVTNLLESQAKAEIKA